MQTPPSLNKGRLVRAGYWTRVVRRGRQPGQGGDRTAQQRIVSRSSRRALEVELRGLDIYAHERIFMDVSTVFASDEFSEWFDRLDEPGRMDVARTVDQLEIKGVALGFPLSSAIRGTEFPFRELRVQSKGRPLRVIYAFDPGRDAYLIIGGDKTGDDRFYERIVREAERIWTDYLNER